MPNTIHPATAATITWLEQVVIGLNLCPFARAVHAQNQIHYVVSLATDVNGLLVDLHRELNFLLASEPKCIESTLLIVPHYLQDFADYNHFLPLGDLAVEELNLQGVIQLASFHPNYQFADVPVDHVTNYSNRSPFPMLHLLREASVSRAIEHYPDVQGIYERNIATLNRIGKASMDAIVAKFVCDG